MYIFIFFGLSFLPYSQHLYFKQLAKDFPVFYYILSPCKMFWSDFKKDKEKWLCIKNEYYEDDYNPLLANLGRLGREFIKYLDPLETIECYSTVKNAVSVYQQETFDGIVLDQGISQNLSLLEAVQVDMLFMRYPRPLEKINILENQSIHVHIAPTRLREVQILYDQILRIMNEEEIYPSDIIVMAPSIMEYEPYIKSIFGSEVDYQITDLRESSQNKMIEGFLHLLSLYHSRWDINAILQLLEYPQFRQKHNIEEDDIHIIRQWIYEAGIRWGSDENHRNEWMQEHYDGKTMSTYVATWEFGISRLLLGLSMIGGKDDSQMCINFEKCAPFDSVDISNASLLGRLIYVFRSLRDDIKFLDNNFSLTKWVEYLQCLFESYFFVDKSNKKELANSKELIEKLLSLGNVNPRLRENNYSFTTVFHYVEKTMKMETGSFNANNLQTVKFCSMVPMRAIPSKVIYILGMDDDSYPRRDIKQTLNEMKKQSVEYCPSRNDYDRYLFLESILSARKYLIISYSIKSLLDQKEQLPSLILRELLDYLDKAFCMDKGFPSELCVTKHPFYEFDKRCFSEDFPMLQSFSKRNYLAAKAYYDTERKQGFCFIPEFSCIQSKKAPVKDKEIPGIINIFDLCLVARNPLQAYLNKQLGMYIKDSVNLQTEECFTLPYNHIIKLHNEALQSSLESAIDSIEMEGNCPSGIFNLLMREEISKEHLKYKEYLSQLGVDKLFSVELVSSCKQHTQIPNGNWLFPKLSLRLDNGKEIFIIGKLDKLCSKGMILFNKDHYSKTFSVWPKVLVMNCLRQCGLLLDSNLLFIKEEKMKNINTVDPFALLKDFVEYYLQCLDNISLLYPDCIPDLLSKDVKSLQKKIINVVNGHWGIDKYFAWAFHDKELCLDPVLNDSIYQPVYKSFLEALY